MKFSQKDGFSMTPADRGVLMDVQFICLLCYSRNGFTELSGKFTGSARRVSPLHKINFPASPSLMKNNFFLLTHSFDSTALISDDASITNTVVK